jgi:Holliday junction resolvase-like predicted endonuclease
VLTENDVVDAVCRHLAATGYEIVSRCATNQRGVDIVAKNDSQVLRVECKGEGSNQPTSKRYGKAFTRAQCHNHVAVAFCTAAEMLGAHAPDRVAIAFPDTRLHREFVGRVQLAIEKLEIGVYWVGADRRVVQR